MLSSATAAMRINPNFWGRVCTVDLILTNEHTDDLRESQKSRLDLSKVFIRSLSIWTLIASENVCYLHMSSSTLKIHSLLFKFQEKKKRQ